MSNPVVVRNEQSKELSEEVFGKTSPNKGTKFWAPTIKEPDLTKFSEEELAKVKSVFGDYIWYGLSGISLTLTRAARAIFAGIAIDPENKNPDGTVNEDALMADWADFSAGQASLTEINEQIEELFELQNSYVYHENFGATVDGTENGAKTPEAIALEDEMKKVNARIRPLKVKKAALQKEFQERSEKRKATKAANEAKAKAAAGTA